MLFHFIIIVYIMWGWGDRMGARYSARVNVRAVELGFSFHFFYMGSGWDSDHQF